MMLNCTHRVECLQNALQRGKKINVLFRIINWRVRRCKKLTHRGLLRGRDRRDAFANHTITNALNLMASTKIGKCEMEDCTICVGRYVQSCCTRFDYVIMSSDRNARTTHHYIIRAHMGMGKKEEIILDISN